METEIKVYLYIKSRFAGVPEHFVECTNDIPFDIVEKSREYVNTLQRLSIIFVDKIFSSVQIRNFSKHLYQFFVLENVRRDHHPFLIISNDFPDKKDKKINIHTLFNNSCIWVRCINAENLSNNDFMELEDAINFFDVCSTLKLYEQSSAKEYLNYHVNIQNKNYLKGEHNNIVPNRYSSEVFDENEKESLNKKLEVKKEAGIENIGIRLLLIDDKIPCLIRHNELKPCEIKRDIECDNCKLRIVKELLSKNYDFCGFEPIWNTNNVQAYTIRNKKEIEKIGDIEKKNNIQIIGVNSIEFARRIMAEKSFKCDLILLDYYFHINSAENYGTELLKFIEQEQKDRGIRSKVLEKLRQNIRQNAGLENRFWIFPITAFPSSFLTDLHSKGVPLLTSKWYIYTPTNPIVMPKRFLRNLNEFVGMMLERSIYEKGILKGFLEQTLNAIQTIDHDAFISFMGSEYSRFMHLYGHKLTIKRDKDKSLFAKFIWDNFYGINNGKNQEACKSIINFNGYLQDFYYLSANCTQDVSSIDKLRDAWQKVKLRAERQFAIDINGLKKMDDAIDNLNKNNS